jgi:ATP-dependent Lon protease
MPAEGPSLGITMATAIASALMRVPVRQNIAMTGEVTLRGRVLAIGGLKEKILAAHRAGVTTVIIPDENAKDLKDIPPRVLEQLTIVPVKHMDEVLRVALAVINPDEFLREPSMVVDWRVVEAMPPADPSAAH